MKKKFILLFDPLCAWCYGAYPAITKLASTHELELVPTGLFMRPGYRLENGESY
ncbi:hypothetical protein [Psittacicella gerlachiana]|uniref:hypothetical protein n=1 Tax=Psittacicella gerlachiana TaxID=2028574 RepID=UPI001CA6BED8|nr:hypothetical protein [Psittacicella gerlachiana]